MFAAPLQAAKITVQYSVTQRSIAQHSVTKQRKVALIQKYQTFSASLDRSTLTKSTNRDI